jgi:hypothetical protein
MRGVPGVPCNLIFICCRSSARSSSICHMSAMLPPIASRWLGRHTLGVDLSSCPSRNVRSLTARVSSKLFFCLLRWKRKAILRGMGSFPLRRSGYDDGVGMKGCNLRPGPGSCYLDGDDMQAIAREISSVVSGLLIVYRGAMRVVVRRPLCYGDVKGGGSSLPH